MLWAIVKKELLGHLVSFRFIVSTVILLMLALLAARVGTEDYKDRYDSYLRQVEKHALDLSETTVYSFFQPVASRAPEALSVLDRGFDARLGSEVKVNIFTIPLAAADGNRDTQRLTSLRDLSLDLTTIVNLILGLLALLLTFDAVCGERERGTLRLILGNDVARSTVLLGKFLGALLTLIIPLIASLLLSLWVLVGWGGVALEAGQWLRLSGLFFAYGAYLWVMLWAGLGISLIARRASAALAFSLLAWLVSVFLIPQLAIAVASGAGRIDDSAETSDQALADLIAARDAALAEPLKIAEAKRGLMHLKRSWAGAARYRFSTAAHYAALASYYSQETALGLANANRIFEIRRATDRRQRAFEGWVRFLTYLSPSYLLTRLSESFAGTSVADHEAFLQACRSYRVSVVEYLQRVGAFESWRWFTDDDPEALRPMSTLRGMVGESSDGSLLSEEEFELWLQEENDRLDAARRLDLEGLPALHSPELGVVRAVARVRGEIAALSLAGGLLVLLAVVQFRDYSPR